MNDQQLSIETLKDCNLEIASEIGELLPDLSARFSGEPIDIELLRAIVESPDRDLLVARIDGKIVGMAVMNRIVFTWGKKAWLEDFVVSADEAVRGKGVGHALWQEIVAWAKARDAMLEFTSSPTRERAQEFYLRQGAKVRPTTVFRLEL